MLVASLIVEILFPTKVWNRLSAFFIYFRTEVLSVQKTESSNCSSALNILSTRTARTVTVSSKRGIMTCVNGVTLASPSRKATWTSCWHNWPHHIRSHLCRKSDAYTKHAQAVQILWLRHLLTLNSASLASSSSHLVQCCWTSLGKLTSHPNFLLHSSCSNTLPGRVTGAMSPKGLYTDEQRKHATSSVRFFFLHRLKLEGVTLIAPLQPKGSFQGKTVSVQIQSLALCSSATVCRTTQLFLTHIFSSINQFYWKCKTTMAHRLNTLYNKNQIK